MALTILIFAPAVMAAIVAFLPESRKEFARTAALIGSLMVFAFSAGAFSKFIPDYPGMQFTENVVWVQSLGIYYHLGMDGLSVYLVLLTTFLTPLAILVSWNSVQDRVPLFNASLLLLEAGMLGVFLAQDLILFYVFWEVMLVPMYFLIGIWGSDKRIKATFIFVLYTMVGSLLMLVAIVSLAIINAQNLAQVTGQYYMELLTFDV